MMRGGEDQPPLEIFITNNGNYAGGAKFSRLSDMECFLPFIVMKQQQDNTQLCRQKYQWLNVLN